MGLRVRTTRGRPPLCIRAAPGTAPVPAGTTGVLLALLLLFPPGAAAQESAGPLRTSEQNPLYRLLYVPETEPAAPLREGALRFELSSSYSNILEASNRVSHAHLFDLEQMTNSLAVRYGWTDAFEVGARVGWYTGWGGFLDPFISGFHNFFGLPNGGRGQRPDGAYVLLLEHDGLEGGRFELDPANGSSPWKTSASSRSGGFGEREGRLPAEPQGRAPASRRAGCGGTDRRRRLLARAPLPWRARPPRIGWPRPRNSAAEA